MLVLLFILMALTDNGVIMPIINFNFNDIGSAGENPAIRYLATTDTVAQVTAPGYLNALASSNLPVAVGDMFLVNTFEYPGAPEGVAFYAVSRSNNNFVLLPANSPFPIVTVPYGGTGLTSAVPYSLLAGGIDATGNLQYLPDVGTAGQLLTSGGPGELPTWTSAAGIVASVSGTANRITSTGGANPVIDIAATYVGQTSIVHLGSVIEGTWSSSATKIGLASGGTNAALTAAAGAIPYSTASALALTAVGNAGQVLTSQGASPPIWANPGDLGFTNITGTTQTAVVNTRYLVSNAGATTVTLPATAALGDEVTVAGQGAAGWTVQAAGGQTINVGSTASSVAGTVASSNRYDNIRLMCSVANTTWVWLGGVTSAYTIT